MSTGGRGNLAGGNQTRTPGAGDFSGVSQRANLARGNNSPAQDIGGDVEASLKAGRLPTIPQMGVSETGPSAPDNTSMLLDSQNPNNPLTGSTSDVVSRPRNPW
jgi:hypothetical protein